jgi:hypothetical protein
MMRLYPLLGLVAGGLIVPLPLSAQSDDSLSTPSSTVQPPLQQFLDERPQSSQSSAQAVERLTRLATHPIDVNRASTSDLRAIPSLSSLLARRIVEHRTEQGPFASLDALTAVNGLSTSTLHSIRPFVIVRSPSSASGSASSVEGVMKQLEVELLQRATRELDLGRGFDDAPTRTTFQGSPGRLTTRLRIHHDQHGQMALTLDKDPGETLRWRPEADQYGFDHVAGNLTLRDLGPVETLILGDYSAQFGQGLTLWRGFTIGKGGHPVSPLVRSGRGLVPFQSTSESRFFRGAASTIRLSRSLSVSAFASHRQRDATPQSDSASAEDGPVRNLSTGGLHRTPSERRRRNTLGISTAGGALNYRSDILHVGTVGYRSTFDRPLRPPPTPSQRHAVSGTGTSMIGTYARILINDYTLFGEAARASTGAYGGILGATLDHQRVQALLLGRYYPRSFPGLYNAAVGASGDPKNEVGAYVGLQLQVAENWRVGGYVDQYRFPWLRYSVPRPSRGIDSQIHVEYTPRPWLSSSLEVQAEREEQGTERPGPGRRSLSAVQSEMRTSVQWKAEYVFSDNLTLRTRLQGSRFRAEGTSASYGLLFAQGIELRPVASVSVDARLAFFDTDDYASRLYAYERDLLYSFSVPALYGEGRRSYVLLQYDPTPSLTLEAKYGVTWYPRRRTLGSGLNATDGPSSREVRLQLRWSL